MTPVLHTIVFLATVLWCHAAVLAWEWLGTLRRAIHSDKIGHVVNLLGAMVPVVVTYIAVVFAGALLGLPSMVAFLALVVPGGLVYGFRTDLGDETPSTLALERRRMVLTIALAVPVLLWRAWGRP